MKARYLQHMALFGIPGCVCAFSQTLKERATCCAALRSSVPICLPLCVVTSLAEQPGCEAEGKSVPVNGHAEARLHFGHMEPISF